MILFLSFLIIRGLLSCREKDYKDILCRVLQDGKVWNQRLACRHQGLLLQQLFLPAQLEDLFESDKISVHMAFISILYLYPVTELLMKCTGLIYSCLNMNKLVDISCDKLH